MKNLIITIALVILFSILLRFQWEMNGRTWRAYSDEAIGGAASAFSYAFANN